MPELPEVETLSCQLQEKICGRKILATEVYDSKLADIKNLKGRIITAVERKGKTIAILLDDGNFVLIHLRMTGRLFWQEDSTRPKHSRWRITFVGGNVFLIDPRRFATIKIIKKVESQPSKDIFKEFDLKDFIKNHGSRRAKVKSLIMDQRAVAGIGNIYASEILHRAGIHPERIAATLTKDDWKKIFHQAKAVLKTAIRKRGTSISDWRDLYGRKGENQHELKAYGQVGKRCSICGGTICRIKQGGRGTFYCPSCQK
ncbi:MAG: bifunctional DNA-formamidopyrimidine glycosylase/DNA-(apurinic or apyrimidinic site) lyase [Deltaproteobacteria bacterium]|nr:bifunctional DNA-formamidopyrimidine glycosylase/DNA-(apurinic or apyrimidinic site) lyase [Deltaproteobacteria bacterium]